MQDAVAIMYLKELPFTKLNFYDHIPTSYNLSKLSCGSNSTNCDHVLV